MPANNTWLDKSPFRTLRLQLAKTQNELAREIDCAVSAILYNEQALYSQPLKVIEDHFVEKLGLNREALRKNYFSYQRATRKRNKRLWLLPPVDSSRNPLKELLKFNNFQATRFSKTFCVAPVTLRDPKVLSGYLEKALSEAGLTRVQLDELNERMKEHQDWQKSEALRNTPKTWKDRNKDTALLEALEKRREEYEE